MKTHKYRGHKCDYRSTNAGAEAFIRIHANGSEDNLMEDGNTEDIAHDIIDTGMYCSQERTFIYYEVTDVSGNVQIIQ